MSTRPTLTYWNGRGRAEVIRLMLAATGTDYDEAVPGFPGVTHLSEKAHMDHLRAEGCLPVDQVPLLCIDGLRLSQSRAIVRYLAAKNELCGDGTPEQAVRCDMVAETLRDWHLIFEFGLNGYEPSPVQLDTLRTANAKYLPRLERVLRENGTGLFVGKQLTYADILALEVLEEISPHETLDQYPCLRQLHVHVSSLPRIAAWLQSDKRKNKTQETVGPYKVTVMRTLGM